METLTLNQVSSSVLTARTTSTESIGFKTHSAYSTLIFLAVDLLAFVIAISIAKSLIHFVYGDVIISLETSLHILSSIAIAPVVIGFFGLYPGYGIGAVDELKKVTYSVFVAFSLILTLTFYFSFSSDITKIFISVSWLIAHVALPVSRVSTRHLLSQTEWWGLPVAIIGAGALGEKIIKKMKTDKNLGIRPVVAFDNDSDRWGYLDGLPVVGNLEVSGKISKKLNITSAILTLENENELHYLSTIKLIMKNFKRVIITSGEHYYGNVWPKVCNLSGIIGLVSQNKLLHPLSYIPKRIFDILFSFVLIIISLPVFIIISVLILFSSKGSIIYKQVRVGKNDSRFNIYKFRTMYVDADKRLRKLLSSNDDLRQKYGIYHKLNDDPRITKIGKILRKYSLDEIPQFFNVLLGDMSLIGPRPRMPWEKKSMNGSEEIILRAKPGLTGYWQVTERYEASFEARNQLDIYYIRDWSIFLDIYIFIKTIGIMVSGKGV